MEKEYTNIEISLLEIQEIRQYAQRHLVNLQKTKVTVETLIKDINKTPLKQQYEIQTEFMQLFLIMQTMRLCNAAEAGWFGELQTEDKQLTKELISLQNVYYKLWDVCIQILALLEIYPHKINLMHKLREKKLSHSKHC